MSMFSGANHVTITGGNFTNAFPPPPPPPPPVANVSFQNGIVGVLHSHSATAGLLDAKERFDAPKCDEGTRTSMILGMKNFVQDGDAASSPGLYWLHGPAGVGKSALAQSLSLLLKSEGDYAASFFFSRTSSGRNNGDQLIVTLAYQLTISFPALRRYMSKAVRENPAILTASNAMQIQTLIVDPVNKWRKKYEWSIRRLMDRLTDAKPHPRLILVDGLDECNDPNMQTDLILCIASAVRHLSIPLRFVVVSRPELHILTTFELHSAFQGPDGVPVTKKNLGDDEDADEHITKFLLKEFAEIRRVHPVRDSLPPEWPRPDQIRQLVAKSSKGFIYATTVTRYIKTSHNRPDECLERILGLSKIPAFDKPYEALDALYCHIFESIPKAHKTSVHSIFHFLVVPSTWDGVTDPRAIERHFDYPRDHVRHVLGHLLCLVEFNPRGRFKILHASLPDFLLDKSRSGPLCIDVGNAHTTIAAGYLLSICLTNELPRLENHFPDFLDHMMQANMSNALLGHRISQMNLLPWCMGTCDPYSITRYEIDPSDSSLKNFADDDAKTELVRQNIHGIAFMAAYLLILVIQHGPEYYIRDQISAIKTFVIGAYPAAGDVHVVNDQIIPFMVPSFRRWQKVAFYHEHVARIFACKVALSQNELREAIFEIYCLLMARLCQHVISLRYSKAKARGSHLTRHIEQRIRRGPDFWANIVNAPGGGEQMSQRYTGDTGPSLPPPLLTGGTVGHSPSHGHSQSGVSKYGGASKIADSSGLVNDADAAIVADVFRKLMKKSQNPII